MTSKEKNFWLFPFFLVFYEITNYLSNDMYLPALPTMVSDLKITEQLAQMTVTMWFLGTASMQLVLGPISDRVGRRPVLLGGCVLFIITTAICALTANINIFLVARFFQGAVVCSILTAGYSSIHETYEQTKAIHILAIMGGVVVIAPAFGPLVGSLILTYLNWRWIFGLLAICGAVGMAALWVYMPESNPKTNRTKFNIKHILQNYTAIFFNAEFMLNTLIFCIGFMGIIAWVAGGPFLVIGAFKLSTASFGFFQLMIFGSMILGSRAVKPFMDRLGVQRLIDLGLYIVVLAGAIGLVLTWIFPHFIWGLIIALMLFVFGSGLAFSPSHRLAIEACDEPMGVRMAVFSSMLSFAAVAGGLLVSLTDNETLFWFGKLLFSLGILAILVRRIDRRRARRCA
jgi:Bcr/CflA subfamily drug resistance transporter